MTAVTTHVPDTRAPSQYFVIKVAARCNINCSYCYMFNKGDESFTARPKRMSREVATQAVDRIVTYGEELALPVVHLVLHGGEPLLVGKDWFAWFVGMARARASGATAVTLSVQTNGTLLDAEWIDLFARLDVQVGVSIDGPPEWHDRFRLSFSGRGTYEQTRRGLELLAKARPDGPDYGVLAVANPGFSSSRIYRHFLSLGVSRMDFLWPDFHHDAPPPWRPGALADYFIELFDAWFTDGDPSISIRWFESVMLLIIGEAPLTEGIGAGPVASVVIETDGSLQPLDVLRICGDRFTELGLNVDRHNIPDLRATDLYRECLDNESLLAPTCLECPILRVCGGGYLPSRWARDTGFTNPSVHCRDLYRVIAHIDSCVHDDVRTAKRVLCGSRT